MSVRVEGLREAACALEQERESIMEMIQSIRTGQEMRNICPGEAAHDPSSDTAAGLGVPLTSYFGAGRREETEAEQEF